MRKAKDDPQPIPPPTRAEVRALLEEIVSHGGIAQQAGSTALHPAWTRLNELLPEASLTMYRLRVGPPISDDVDRLTDEILAEQA